MVGCRIPHFAHLLGGMWVSPVQRGWFAEPALVPAAFNQIFRVSGQQS
jgi:hypothetical protein